MKDTVKLIIEISEEKLNIIKNKMYCGIYDPDLYKSIADGTPLDDVKAEMESLIDWHDCPIELDNGNDSWYCQAVNQCLEIIDRHIGKAESEDKE